MLGKNKDSSSVGNVLTQDQIKYEELGSKLEEIGLDLEKEKGFLKHVRKLAKMNEEDYEEELNPAS